VRFRRPPAAELLADPARDPYTLQAHVLVAPVHPLSFIADRWASNRESNLHLARHYDALRRFMYLPPMPGDTEEWLVDLTQIGSIALGLAGNLARLTQLTSRAAQQLQFKLVMAATGVVTDPGVYQPPMD
jgi:hypothetical protein